MANEAQLNLVISARDEAKAVIEEMISNIKSAFDGLKDMTAGINLNGMEQPLKNVADATLSTRTSLEESINAMKTSADTLATTMTESSDKSAQAMRSLEGTISNVGTQIEDILNNIGQSSQHLNESLDFMNLQMAGEMIQHVGEQFTGFFDDAVHSAANFDQNIVNTTASLNANLGTMKLSTSQIQAMQNAAIKMGESGFYSANEVAEAMNVMSRNGLTYQQIMSGGIDTVYKVAAANQSSIEETANVVSDIYNEMGETFKVAGMNAQQAAQMIGNSMTVAMHHARISMDDFMTTMKYVGPQASAMGVGIKDVSSLISLLGQHAIRGSQAGTTLRTMLTNLTPVSKAAAEEMKKLGMITKNGSNIFFDATGHMKPMAEVQQLLHDKIGALNPQMQEMAIKTIFGRYAMSGMTAIVDTAPSKFQSLTSAMNNNNTMTDIMKEKSTGLGMQIQKLNSHWETIKKTIGEALKPTVEWLIGGLNSLMKSWEGLSPGVKQAIVVISAITGVVLLVGGGLFALIGTIGMFVTAFTSGMAVLGAIGGVIMGPVGIIIAAVALIGIAAFEIYQHWDQVKAWLIAAWQAISNTAKSVWNGISSFFSNLWDSISQAASDAWNGIVSFFTGLWNGISQTASNIWNGLVTGIQNIWNGAISWIKGAAQAFVNIPVEAFQWMYNHNYYFKDLVDFIRNAWNTIKSDAEAVWNTVKSWVTNLWNGIVDTAKTVWNGLVNILSTVWNAIKSAAEAFWNREKQGFENIWNGIVNVAKTVWNTLTSFFSGLWNTISSGVSSAWNGIKSTISNLVNGAINAIKGPFNSLGSFFSGLWNQAYQWGSNLISMVADGIKSAIGKVTSAVSGVASGISKFLGFHSPAEDGPGADADKWMPNMMNMFVKGVQDNAPKLQMAIGNVALGLKTGTTQMGNVINQNHISIPSTINSANRTQPIININVDGRSAKTDKELVDMIADKFYKQMGMVSVG